MTTIDPNSAQAALFEKLGLTKQSDIQKANSEKLGQKDFSEVNDDTASKSRSFCAYGQW